jgi:hypothetical protein
MPACSAPAASAPPREFVLMDRSAIGLGRIPAPGRELNWHQMFHELIADFDSSRLPTRCGSRPDFSG